MTPDEALKYFAEKKTAYQAAFAMAPHGPAVLADLMSFCRARETCVIPGKPDLTCVAEGRREVFLRIQDYLDRTPEELVAMFTKPLEGDKANG